MITVKELRSVIAVMRRMAPSLDISPSGWTAEPPPLSTAKQEFAQFIGAALDAAKAEYDIDVLGPEATMMAVRESLSRHELAAYLTIIALCEMTAEDDIRQELAGRTQRVLRQMGRSVDLGEVHDKLRSLTLEACRQYLFEARLTGLPGLVSFVLEQIDQSDGRTMCTIIAAPPRISQP
jgi:hypothetical protein